MAFSLDRVVPWGRNLDEYSAMFALTADDLTGSLLGCADGPASFNAELSATGKRVVSVDPLYAFEAEKIRQRIDACFDEIIAKVELNRTQFVWHSIGSVDELARVRRTAMERFLSDYRQGEPRYVDASLPTLPFADGEFDLALCSHFLFLYTEQLDLDFHVDSLRELCRVATEVRVFPLIDLAVKPSKHVAAVRERLESEGCYFSIEPVEYEFQRGGNEMLRLRLEKG